MDRDGDDALRHAQSRNEASDGWLKKKKKEKTETPTVERVKMKQQQKVTLKT